MNENLEYHRGQVEQLETELELAHEEIFRLKLERDDALRLAQDYKDAFARIEAELRELRTV